MAQRGFIWRAAFILAGCGTAIMLGVVLSGGPEYVVVIDWRMYKEDLQNAQVLIDGDVAGRLVPRSPQARSRFAVGEGDHEIAIRREPFGSEPRRITTGFGAREVYLMAEVETRSQNDRYESVVVLR